MSCNSLRIHCFWSASKLKAAHKRMFTQRMYDDKNNTQYSSRTITWQRDDGVARQPRADRCQNHGYVYNDGARFYFIISHPSNISNRLTLVGFLEPVDIHDRLMLIQLSQMSLDL